MDIASMANSLEARSPLLDHNLIEFTATLPSSWKLKYGFQKKHILKKAFDKFLPGQIMRRSKQGFGIPVGKWLMTDLKGYMCDILYSKEAAGRPYFDQTKIKQLVQNHVSGKEDHGYRLFALIVLELWHRIFVDKQVRI
jgi:asparagine synthase (glutamine-hydrolysing)